MVITCTIRALLKNLNDQGISVSFGKVLRLRPFFVTYPSDKEISLCLCKLCLNTKLVFQCLKAQAKKDGEELGYSISEFFMVSCPCNKSPNGYPDHQTKVLKCKNDHEKQVKAGQFETITTMYTKNNKPKKSTKTEHVELTLTMAQVFEKIVSLRYTEYKYQIYNINFIGFIYDPPFHILVIFITDFSENVSQHFKYEPQYSHFNKKQYSLHCTARHKDNSPYDHYYHLSDEMKHNYSFTSAVVEHLLQSHSENSISRFKSDNCATQYKCKWIFRFWSTFALNKKTKVTVYYGVSGHGKRLVDAMSAFRVKSPLLRAVVSKNFFTTMPRTFITT